MPPAARIKTIDAQHLPNLVQVHERVFSGGLPANEAAFAELRDLGIQTVISVDGAKPNVDLAQQYGLRYVHLPHGYDGITSMRGQELSKAVRDLPGPIYVHCHHGKHRSPAAAAVACVGAGLIDQSHAARVLQVAGTSEAYRGLFHSVQAAQRWDDTILDKLPVEFPAVAQLPVLAEVMVEIDHLHDHLKASEQLGWNSLDDHPEHSPAHSAVLMREQFTELLRSEQTTNHPERFLTLLREAEAVSRALEQALASSASRETWPPLLHAITENCRSCHVEYRDVPLGEK